MTHILSDGYDFVSAWPCILQPETLFTRHIFHGEGSVQFILISKLPPNLCLPLTCDWGEHFVFSTLFLGSTASARTPTSISSVWLPSFHAETFFHCKIFDAKDNNTLCVCRKTNSKTYECAWKSMVSKNFVPQWLKSSKFES